MCIVPQLARTFKLFRKLERFGVDVFVAVGWDHFPVCNLYFQRLIGDATGRSLNSVFISFYPRELHHVSSLEESVRFGIVQVVQLFLCEKRDCTGVFEVRAVSGVSKRGVEDDLPDEIAVLVLDKVIGVALTSSNVNPV